MTSSIVKHEVGSFVELRDRIGELPPATADRVRVYRGQTVQYFVGESDVPSITPSLSRTEWAGRDLDPVWLIAAMQAVRSLLAGREGEHLETRDIWAPALLQHYGARSSFIDVTRDLEVALWFALHRHELRWLSVLPPVTSRGWAEDRVPVATYRRVGVDHVGAVVYVIDAPRWTSRPQRSGGGLSVVGHGEVVEAFEHAGGASLLSVATRLASQRAALLWCEAKRPDLGNIAEQVVACITLKAGFDPAGASGAERSVAEVFPAPDQDPCYRALLQLPPTLRFNPDHTRHPLEIPLYVGGAPAVWEIPSVVLAEAEGRPDTPVRVGRLEQTSESAVRQLASYIELAPRRSPVFLHRDLLAMRQGLDRVTAPIKLGDVSYRFEDALPIVVDAPLWSITPGAYDPADRAMWIESALPVELPDAIDGRPAHSVYVEVSALESYKPGVASPPAEARGVWVVRREDEIAVRAFWLTSRAIEPLTARFIWDRRRGRLEPKAIPGLPPRLIHGTEHEASLLKSALVVLTLLRHFAPGLKPPAAHSVRLDSQWEGKPLTIYQPGTVMEPPLARAEWIEGTPYLRPRAMDGSTYALASGNAYGDGWDVPARERLSIWARHVPRVTDPFYAVAAGIPLAEHHAYFEEFDLAVEAAARARTCAHGAGLHLWDDRLDFLEAQAEISRGHAARARTLLQEMSSRARRRGALTLASAVDQLAATQTQRTWGQVIEPVPGVQIVQEPAGAAAILFH